MATTTHSHWHKIIDDLLSLVQAGGGGFALHQALKNEKLKGKNYALALTCGSCLSAMYFAVDRIHHNHLESDSESPDIACHNCGHSGNHHYNGISE